MFFGDSITEEWTGKSLGKASEKYEGVPEVFQQHFGQLRTQICAVAGASSMRAMQQCVASVTGVRAVLYFATRPH